MMLIKIEVDILKTLLLMETQLFFWVEDFAQTFGQHAMLLITIGWVFSRLSFQLFGIMKQMWRFQLNQ